MGQALLIRADGSTQIGTGHVMRCLALAQAWQDSRGPVYWLAHTLTPALQSRLLSEGIHLLPPMTELPGTEADAISVAQATRHLNASWTVIDSYDFRGDYQDHLRQRQIRHLAFDDNGHADHYCAHLVLNGNFHACEDFYRKRHPETRLLLGCRYTPLRREIRCVSPVRSPASSCAPPRVLVTFGGSDPQNMTLRALEAMMLLGPQRINCTVIIGGSNPHRSELQAFLSAHDLPADLEIDVTDMGQRMARCDLALMAGGSSTLEALYFGLPMVIATIADNQIQLANELNRAGLALLAGHGPTATPQTMAQALDTLLLDPDRRHSMTRSAQACVDGKGVARILEMMDI